MPAPRSSLVVGDRVVARCDDGLLEVEYALFDAEDVLVTAQLGFGQREQGYLTTASLARGRLRAAGINQPLTRQCFAALRALDVRALARAPLVIPLLERLTPYEAFEGGLFRAATHIYDGVWLNLGILSRACPLHRTAHLMQAMHLLCVLEEVGDDVPVRLLTAGATADFRLGARTGAKVRFDGARRLARELRAMRGAPLGPPVRIDNVELRRELLANLRARSLLSQVSRPRVQELAADIARVRRTPAYGTAAVDVETATAALKRTPQPRHRQRPPPEPRDPGPDPLRLIEELRSHTDLLRGEAHLRDVARFLSAMSDRSAKVPDLTLLAARAWLAAGEVGHARHFAKRLAVWSDDTREDIRLAALEILNMTAPTNQSSAPPPVASIEPKPVVVLASEPERSAPAGASLPPYVAEPAPPRVPSAPRMPVIDVTPVTPTPPPPEPHEENGAPTSALRSAPPPTGELPRFTPGPSEIVESLSYPDGLDDGVLPEGASPTTPAQARVAMTRLARTVGRDYRIWYGTTLKTNAIAIEFMQRHLRRRFGDAVPDAKVPQNLEAELTRHGALLSEIIARSLGGQWYDVLKEEPGHWGMLVPPSIRVWPIGRVYRFFRQGHREADLVAFYLELEHQSQGEK